MRICSLRNENPLENAEFKFSVNNEGEEVNKKPRSRRNIAEHSEGNADNKRQRNRRLESQALWSFYIVKNPDFLVCGFPRRYIDQSLQSSISARRIIIFEMHRTIFVLSFFLFLNPDAEIMPNLLFNTLLTITPHNTQKEEEEKKEQRMDL